MINRLLCKARYKKALRAAKANFNHSVSNNLVSKQMLGDSKAFWAKWNTVFGARKITNATVGGRCKPDEIAQGFADYLLCH